MEDTEREQRTEGLPVPAAAPDGLGSFCTPPHMRNIVWSPKEETDIVTKGSMSSDRVNLSIIFYLITVAGWGGGSQFLWLSEETLKTRKHTPGAGRWGPTQITQPKDNCRPTHICWRYF